MKTSLTAELYMKGIEATSLPLSCTAFLGLASDFLAKVYSSFDAIIEKAGIQTKTPFDVEFKETMICALAYQAKIGLATVQYVLGFGEKNEVLNAIDDMEDYVKSRTTNPEVYLVLNKVIPEMRKDFLEMVKDREVILQFEADHFSDDVEKQVIKALKDMDVDALNLKRGESYTEQVGETSHGKIMRTAIRLPFEVGSPVISGSVRGNVVGYVLDELINGITDKTTVVIECLGDTGGLPEFELKDPENFSHPNKIHSGMKYVQVLVSETKQYLM